MPRKGENIRKRKDGRWEARYEKCRDQNGRIQYGYLYGRTYEAVKKKKLAVLCQNNLQNSPGKCYVFRNLSEEWMLSMRYAVKLSTYACYETLLDTHILPEFGDMPLKYISSASVYAFSEKLKQQGLSPRTIKNLLILFHSILRYGEKQGYLNLSQLEFRYPKINTSPFQLISHEHLTKLITVLSAEDSEFPIGILLCIYTGIRVGELSGIRWEDIDFDKKLLHIRRTISRIKNLDYSGESNDEPKTVLMIGPPKSISSIRDIPIPDPVYASTGAAIGTLVAELAVFIVQYMTLKNEVHDSFKQIHFIKITIALVLASLASLWIKGLGWGDFAMLVISAILFFGVYGITLLILKEEMILEILEMIKLKRKQ